MPYGLIGLYVTMITGFVTVIVFLKSYMDNRFNGVDQRFQSINQRFDDMRDLWRAELKRVEEVLDARLKHLEEREPR
jgi:hypothetical protein